MTLAPRTRLGPYEISAKLGAGGMGEVYRARDERLGRDVAVKVLPDELSADRDRLARFEKEARAASALNHPNVVTIYDIGFDGAVPWLAMEYVDGLTLREMLRREEVLSPRKLLEIGAQLAHGLAKAHAAGIVHRDLKPENVMVTRDGFVKILDFGLVKLVEDAGETADDATAARGATRPGMVLGTIGYMSPEQAAGRVVDFTSDQFSVGTILYELATGRQPFKRETTAETLVAIMRDEPEPLSLGSRFPPPLRWLIERCLAKDPEERYASTRDLARDLENLRDHLGETMISGEVAVAAAAEPPTYQRLTFRRGTVLSARFAPDGQTIIYGASWDGNPTRLFSTRPESAESSPLMLPDAEILAISRSGMMAISLERRWAGRFIWTGTLAQVPLVGGAPREILEDVQWADWAPDGSSLAVVRSVGGKTRLEFPIGTILYETGGWVSHPRVSPRGDAIAFFDHPTLGDDSGSLMIVDRTGRITALSHDWITGYGLAWSPDGKEIWFTATRAGLARAIWAATLGGRERLLVRTPGELTIQDVSEEGQVLVTSDNGKVGIVGQPPGHTKENDLSLLDWSLVREISADGKLLLFDESGEGGGSEYAIYVRRTDGSPAVRLGSGKAFGFSPDGRWVASMTMTAPRKFFLLPVKAGEPRQIDVHGLTVHAARWMPDGERILIAGNRGAEGVRLFVLALSGGEPRAISPDGTAIGFFPISPDGKWVAAQGADQAFYLYAIDGDEEPKKIPSLGPDERPVRWTPVGQALYVFRRGELPGQVFLLDLATGRKEAVRELIPPDPAGMIEIISVQLTPDAASYAYSYHRILSDLLLVQGLR
jgi:Tol biopolymer transport system component/predicted Ser/Thr protein kinase